MKYLIPLFVTLNIFATTPTIEGLFRNPAAPDIEKDLTVLTFKVSVEDLTKKIDTDVKATQPTEAYYKYIFDLTTPEQPSIITRYPNKELNNDEALKVVINKTNEDLAQGDNEYKIILNAIFSMYAKNSSVLFNKVFKKVSGDYKTNYELINQEKKELLGKYKEYLVQKNEYEEKMKTLKQSGAVENPEETPEIEAPTSPLIAEEVEDKEKINTIISDSMYSKTNFISLKKEGKKFFWNLEMSNIAAKFTNESHQLKYLRISSSSRDYEVFTNDYVAYSGSYLLPKMFKLKTLDTEIKVEVIGFYAIDSKKKQFSQRIADYMKIKSNIKVPKTDIEIIEPSEQAIAEQEHAKLEISDYFY